MNITELPLSIPQLIFIIVGIFVLLAVIIVVSVMRKVSPVLNQAKNMMAGQVQTQIQSNALKTGGGGVPAQAVVLSVQPTNKLLNNVPVVGMTLEVKPPQGGAPYQVSIESPVAHIHLPQVQPNATVPVMLNPNNPNHVVLAL